jgi:thiol-disulfide isomerase/thioredoxin
MSQPVPDDRRGRSLVPRAVLVVGVVVVALAGLAVVASTMTDDPLSVDRVEDPDEVPPRDAYLVDGGWPEAAAWIRRENADGRPVLVNILASWCAPCRDELPVLIRAHEDNPDIAFLGIDHLDRREDAEAFLEEMNVTFPTLFDINGDVAAAVQARGMPTTLIFDADGDLVAHHSGLVTASQLEDLLDRVR